MILKKVLRIWNKKFKQMARNRNCNKIVSRQIVLVGLKQDLVEDENEVWR